MTWLNFTGIALLARFFLVVLFPFSALDKIINRKDALKQAESSFLPGGPILLVIAIAVELVTPVCIMLDWHDRMAAFILAGFCVVTAILYHPFWQFSDFWQAGESKGRNHFWDFLKNLGLAGGLLTLMLLGNLLPMSFFVEHPLSSAPLSAANN